MSALVCQRCGVENISRKYGVGPRVFAVSALFLHQWLNSYNQVIWWWPKSWILKIRVIKERVFY